MGELTHEEQRQLVKRTATKIEEFVHSISKFTENNESHNCLMNSFETR